MNARPLVLLMGGSFDPVHQGHVAVAGYFVKLLAPDVLRILPAGDPWQKRGLVASGAQRVEMLRLAFAGQPVPVIIDEQELGRDDGSTTAITLRSLRHELGPEVSLVWILGADQLERLHTWREWQSLFELANLCVAARPGHSLDLAQLDPDVARECQRRQASAAQMRDCAQGLMLFAPNLSWDLSSTGIRDALKRGQCSGQAIPPTVLDYIERHHLYQT